MPEWLIRNMLTSCAHMKCFEPIDTPLENFWTHFKLLIQTHMTDQGRSLVICIYFSHIYNLIYQRHTRPRPIAHYYSFMCTMHHKLYRLTKGTIKKTTNKCAPNWKFRKKNTSFSEQIILIQNDKFGFIYPMKEKLDVHESSRPREISTC